MPVREPRKQRRVRNLIEEHCQKMKESTQGKSGCRRKSAATCRKVSRHAKVAWQKRNLIRNVQTQMNCGACKKFVATGSKMTHCAKVAWRKGNIEISGPGPRLSKGSRRSERATKAERV
jgi:C1A family cysteine protease